MAQISDLRNARISVLHPTSTGEMVRPLAVALVGSSGAGLVDSSNNALGVTVRAGSAGATEYTDGDVDASVTGRALVFGNSSNTLRPVNSTRGLPVQLLQPDSTYASGQASSAGDNIAISSGVEGIYVYALTFSPISTAAQLIRLLNGSTMEMWRSRVLAPSTMGDQTYAACQLAVSPPAYLFRTAAGNPLILNITSSGVSYSLSAWRQ